jgi:glyoxylase-like metal-dependent hydrolase (beta-lactamase superfamily II)
MPGHTPGSFIYLLKGKDHDVIFTGDAAKNRAELLSGKADGTYDQAVSSKSIAAIWTLWKARPGNVVIPGHDIPMVLKEGRPEYLAKREAAMKAWFGDDLDTVTTIELAVR